MIDFFVNLIIIFLTPLNERCHSFGKIVILVMGVYFKKFKDIANTAF
jgi:hypothetical protein